MKDLSRKHALQRIKAGERRLRRLDAFQKSQGIFNRERHMRMLRDARAQAESVESYLSSKSGLSSGRRWAQENQGYDG